MRAKYPLVFELEALMHILREHGMEELRFVKAPYELSLRLREQASPDESEPSGREESGDVPSLPDLGQSSPRTPGRRSYVLLRSPAMGVWSPLAEFEDREAGEKPAGAGTIHTLLGDEKLLPPGRGKAGMWLVADGETVGYGTPVALWEVE